MSEILRLLSLDGLGRSPPAPDAFATAFLHVADQLMNNYVIAVGGNMFRLAEVEFYLCYPLHPDIFTHQDELQRSCACWYFHRQSGGSYKSGSYKGLDITFGPNDAFGGILIRAIEDLTSGDYVDGPCLVVNKLLERAGAGDSIESLVKMSRFSLNVAENGNILSLAKSPMPALTVYASSRVGLTLKKLDGDRAAFICRPYRFVTRPLNVSKGRPNLIMRLYMDGKSNEEIMKITGATKAIVGKAVAALQAARDGKQTAADFAGKELNAGDLCALHGVCWRQEHD